MIYKIIFSESEWNYIKNLNQEILDYLQDYHKFSVVEYNILGEPYNINYVSVYITKEGLEKIMYYLPNNHYLKPKLQGYIDFKIMCDEW